jgi:hypothetical protein
MHGCRQAQNLVRAFVIKTYEKRDKVMLGKNKFMENPFACL